MSREGDEAAVPRSEVSASDREPLVVPRGEDRNGRRRWAPERDGDGRVGAARERRSGGEASAIGAVEWAMEAARRAGRAWRGLPRERRLAAVAALGLFVALFTPWYQETVIARGVTGLRTLSAVLNGWQAFSFVEAAELLVAAGVLALLFARADGRAFHVPGGDGTVITWAGAWTGVLVVWRIFDKQGTTGHGLYETTSGIEWGIFVALAFAGALAYAGTRIRMANDAEPPLPGDPRPPRRRGRGRRATRMAASRGMSSQDRPTAATLAPSPDPSTAPVPSTSARASTPPSPDRVRQRPRILPDAGPPLRSETDRGRSQPSKRRADADRILHPTPQSDGDQITPRSTPRSDATTPTARRALRRDQPVGEHDDQLTARHDRAD